MAQIGSPKHPGTSYQIGTQQIRDLDLHNQMVGITKIAPVFNVFIVQRDNTRQLNLHFNDASCGD